jgi:hypothetical protein
LSSATSSSSLKEKGLYFKILETHNPHFYFKKAFLSKGL